MPDVHIKLLPEMDRYGISATLIVDEPEGKPRFIAFLLTRQELLDLADQVMAAAGIAPGGVG